MTTLHNPKQVFIRTVKRTLFAQVVFMCAVYGTSHNDRQMLINHVVFMLTLIMAILFAVYRAASAEQDIHEEWLEKSKAAIHYPASQTFQEKMKTVEQQNRRQNRDSRFV